MRALSERLQSGQRWWAAELGLRALAVTLLAIAVTCFRHLELRFAGAAGFKPGLAEFGVAVIAFAATVAGLALLIEGPGLFRLVPYPRRRLF